MSSSVLSPEATHAAEIVTSRLFAQSREMLFEAFHHPDHLMHWWGPTGFTNSFREFDPRPGGAWRFTMHAPDGTDYPNASDFVEVVKPERIVFVHLGPVHCFQMTMLFVQEDGGTRLTWRMRFESDDEVAKLGSFIQAANEQNMDRLQAFLLQMPPMEECDRLFLISRHVKAPRSAVYQAWTDARLLAQWWGPHSVTNPECSLDLRQGGHWRIVMRGPDDQDYPTGGIFHEIIPDEKIVSTVDCSDHPPEWHDMVKPGRGPEETNPAGELLQTVLFTGDADRTTLTVRTRFQSRDIRDAFVRMGMHDGWSESLEGLAALLERGE